MHLPAKHWLGPLLGARDTQGADQAQLLSPWS